MIGRAREERRKYSKRRHLVEDIGRSLVASAAEASGLDDSPPYPTDRPSGGNTKAMSLTKRVRVTLKRLV